MSASGTARAALMVLVLAPSASPQTLPERKLEEVVALMARARAKGLVGTARKTKPVDARQAHQGEIVVTAVKGEGKDEKSAPAKRDDWVVRVRCPETGNEQYLVGGYAFSERYRSTSGPISAHGWRTFRPIAKDVRFHVLPSDTDPFSFVAKDGDSVVARPGDAIVQDPRDETNVSLVTGASFGCTYDVVIAPGAGARPAGP